MLISKTNIPASSLFKRLYAMYDYSDCYSLRMNQAEISPELFARIAFTSYPAWVKMLFCLRNILVKPFGIASDSNVMNYSIEPIKKGSAFSFFSVLDFNDNELLLFSSDGHLNAWLSFYISKDENVKTLTLITIVKYNNTKGRIYFSIIKPFHKMIIKSKMKSVYNYLSKE